MVRAKNSIVWNPGLKGAECIRCGARLTGFDFPLGCPICLEEGMPASVRMVYEETDTGKPPKGRGMMRYAAGLPLWNFPSLGEGFTPLLPLVTWARKFGLSRFWIKWEGANPTGSHKDRMSPLIVAAARLLGKTDVVIASSGNAGLSLAAYAAAAGLTAHVIVTPRVPAQVQDWIRSYGGNVWMVSRSDERWPLMGKLVRERGFWPAGNFHVPPVGSNPFGVQGLKTIAYELVEELGEAPDAVIVPTSRGDLLWGIWEGFRECRTRGEISHLPRMVAVEPFPRLTRVLHGEDWRGRFEGRTSLASIDGSTVTYQAVAAVTESGGTAVSVTDREVAWAWKEAARSGLLLESSSASVLAAVIRLVDSGWLKKEESVVAIGTSHGFKERSPHERDQRV